MPEQKNCLLEIRRTYFYLIIAVLVLFVIHQFNYRTHLPHCDYIDYIEAARKIEQGENPYLPRSNYIYTPLLAVVLIPLSRLGDLGGYYLWKFLSIAAFLYGVYRAAQSGWSSSWSSGSPSTPPSTMDR